MGHPVPRVRDWAELNTYLRACCARARERTGGPSAETVATRLERDWAAGMPVPARPFGACVIGPGCVDKYQMVASDGNRCIAPRRWAFRPVTVTGFVDRVEVVADHQVVATHARGYGVGERVLDPLPALGVLDQGPATLDPVSVDRDRAVPPVFTDVRRELEV